MQFEFAEKYNKYKITVISPLIESNQHIHEVGCVKFYLDFSSTNFNRFKKNLTIGVKIKLIFIHVL